MAERVTLDMLAKEFHMSGTSIKNSFKAVYGVSLYAFIRARKMRYAAKLLKDSTMSVLEIAGSVGYENGSKFAKAFRETMGVNRIPEYISLIVFRAFHNARWKNRQDGFGY